MFLLQVTFIFYAVELCDLLQELLKAADKWFTLGVLFKIPSYILECLQKKYHHDPQDCLTNMLVFLQDNTEVTWPKVIEVLCEVGCTSLARDIGKKYGMRVS